MNNRMDKKKEIARMLQAVLLLLSAGAAYGMGEGLNGFIAMPDGVTVLEEIQPEGGDFFPAGKDSNFFEISEGIVSQEVRQSVIIKKVENSAAGQSVDEDVFANLCDATVPSYIPIPDWEQLDLHRIAEVEAAQERQTRLKAQEWQARQEREQERVVQIVEPMVPRGARPYQCGSCAHSFEYEISLYTHEYNKHGMWRSVPFSPQYGQQLAFMDPQWWAMQAHAAAQPQAPAKRQNKVNKTRRFRCNKCIPNRTFGSVHTHAEHMDKHTAQEDQARFNF